ncbi:hypothetical protein [Tabrizicola sp. TH137]|uniref:hypothetical protein n=1 Tax=Tabrizicola sp. TH137 TaxID=2067452 RepID=UPI000C7C7C3C|nr:hypothetical protein [Tabrizicola sp. TH137]
MSGTQPNLCVAECEELIAFLEDLCAESGSGSFVRNLSGRNERWVSVHDLLPDKKIETLDRFAFRPLRKSDRFSSGNLKVHYVLDEDFVNNGSAIVVFALVGSQWTHVIHLRDQNDFTPAEKWLEGQE